MRSTTLCAFSTVKITYWHSELMIAANSKRGKRIAQKVICMQATTYGYGQMAGGHVVPVNENTLESGTDTQGVTGDKMPSFWGLVALFCLIYLLLQLTLWFDKK
jgi:hypothetical protein